MVSQSGNQTMYCVLFHMYCVQHRYQDFVFVPYGKHIHTLLLPIVYCHSLLTKSNPRAAAETRRQKLRRQKRGNREELRQKQTLGYTSFPLFHYQLQTSLFVVCLFCSALWDFVFVPNGKHIHTLLLPIIYCHSLLTESNPHYHFQVFVWLLLWLSVRYELWLHWEGMTNLLLCWNVSSHADSWIALLINCVLPALQCHNISWVSCGLFSSFVKSILIETIFVKSLCSE